MSSPPPPPSPRNDVEGSRIDRTWFGPAATFRLQAELVPNYIPKGEPLTDIHVTVSTDPTNVMIVPTANSLSCYMFPGFLLRDPPPPICTRFLLRASLLSSPPEDIIWIPYNICGEQSRRDDLVTNLLRFLSQVVTEEKKPNFEFLEMFVSVRMDRNVVYNCETERASECYMSTHRIVKGFWPVEKEEEEEEEKKDVQCAVCFEEVRSHDHDFCCQWGTWRSGVKLCCSHVFHLRCIATWLMEKNSCPMCRRVQQYFILD